MTVFVAGSTVAAALLAVFLLVPGNGNRPQESGAARAVVSPEAAESLARKIDAIREAERSTTRDPVSSETLVASEIEMESFVLYYMQDEIPARVDSIDVGLSPGAVSAATELTFPESVSVGNPIVDALLRGSHSMLVRGEFDASEGRGSFKLREVRIDGLPVPIFVIELLVDRFVKPRYPDVDLDSEFDMPWGIERVVVSSGEAALTY